ncbi:MAG: cell division protein FtsA [Lentisphaerae bacterium]|nr:cell division protein FtsA [Lentisphaerota bacterium]
MFNQHNVITAIELGSSKICVLVGSYSGEEPLTVIGRGEVASDNAVFKGEIASMDLIRDKLNDAIDLADKQSGGEVDNSIMFVMTVTGCDISSVIGEGTAFIQNESRRITEEDIFEAVGNAKSMPLNADRTLINSFDAYYKIDGIQRVTQPLNMHARTLNAYSHIIHGNTLRLQNFSAALTDVRPDDEPMKVFSAMADVYGILTSDELASGTLLINLGAGSTEYAVVCNNGVLASGVLGVGFEHVANDLSVGLNLPYEYCSRILRDGTLERMIRENLPYVECRTNSGSMRRIPLDSFNRIIDARLREIFELLSARMAREHFWSNLGSGCVLTGGGAEFFKTAELFHQVCDLPSRIGRPMGVKGISGLESARYSTVYGALCYAHAFCRQQDSRNNSLVDRLEKSISGFGDTLSRFFSMKNHRNN